MMLSSGTKAGPYEIDGRRVSVDITDTKANNVDA